MWGERTADEGEHRHTAIQCQCIQVAAEVRLPDGINNYVDSFSASRVMCDLHKISFFIINSMSGTGWEGQKPVELFRRRCRRGDSPPDIRNCMKEVGGEEQ